MNENNTNTQICTHCATGKKELEFDKSSLFCSYIFCLKDGRCPKYKALTNDEETLDESQS